MSINKFGHVWGASGVQGFFGEGYPYQRLFADIIPGYSFKGVTFVAKTVTANANKGNMPLDEHGIAPRDAVPACIIAGWRQALWGVMLNSVGLSNIGIGALTEKYLWQVRREPYMISIMMIGKTKEDRKEEMRRIIKHLEVLVRQSRSPFAVQLNVSCPNTKHKTAADEFVSETLACLSALQSLEVPIFVKINVLAGIDDMKRIASHPACSGIIVSNTLPWASIPKWMRILFFGSTTSPLAHIGGGGLSGWPLRRRVSAWIRAARNAGITTHINAGGGIFGPLGVWSVYRAGANSISLGSIAAVRPWMLGITVTFANWLFSRNSRRTA